MAIEFDGTGDWATAATFALAGSCSISAFFKADALDYPGNNFDVAGIATKGFWGGDGNGDFRIIIGNPSGSAEQLRCQVNTSSGEFSVNYAITNLSTGVWYHVCAVYNESSTSLKLFVNGVQVGGTTTTTGTMTSNARPIRIGAYPNNEANTEFDGIIEEVAFWDEALTDAEVLNLANSKVKGMPLQIQPAGLRRYWPMDDHADGTAVNGLTFKDLSGNAGVLTAVNGTARSGQVLSYPQDIIYVNFQESIAPTGGTATINRMMMMGIS